MAPRKKMQYGYVVKHTPDFEALMKQVPYEVFAAMVNKSGLPSDEKRDLCDAFKSLKRR